MLWSPEAIHSHGVGGLRNKGHILGRLTKHVLAGGRSTDARRLGKQLLEILRSLDGEK